MTPTDLANILAQHKLWLKNPETGKRANLQDANLWNANLQYANLQYANLWNADLWNADLQGANLHGANLRGADFNGADLQSANLHSVNLQNADLQNAKNFPADEIKRRAILSDGDIVGYKKSKEGYIVTLKIPANARRSNGIGRK